MRPPILGATVDYELGRWRAVELANHVLEWVLDYALRRHERVHLSAGRALELTKRAMRATFGNGGDRGVPGEILLHALCRQFFGSDTVINKVWFKTANNDTYKGFDGVHSVHTPRGLELWLGEAKFYRRIDQAIHAVIADLGGHLEADYLRSEFALVSSKIDDDHPHAGELRRLMHPHSSLDEVFARVVVPILLTYDSGSTLAHSRVCPEYETALEAEVRQIWRTLNDRLDGRIPAEVRLFLVPLADKTAFEQALKAELQKWQ
ncbi:Hachiman antiphage defense system protein HamA [Jiangella mangrovi]|uniref:Anti-bacteriophage protein A/HamA C-terminal domain-containing protein n=1 Tax=Jiangella mangrovi TaxID=1524084 RepID=A0A7W9LM53_9ACTN|nr:hypothetical protein [Jiangella mangrovi]